MPAPLVAIAIVGVIGVVGTATVVNIVHEATSTDAAVVERVIDGDTIDVRIGDATDRVRLLNINAPEDNAATGVSQCMGPEATAALAGMLHPGTEVTLKYDDERRDRYDRLLAGVFIGDTFINAEMARAGLAGTLVVGENDRFLSDVESAGIEARAAGVGIYSDALPCTLGSVVAAYEKQVADNSSAPLPADSANLATTVASAAALVAAADAADAAIESIDWIDLDGRRIYRTRVSQTKDRATQHQGRVERALAQAKAAEEAEAARIAAEKAEADRLAAEKAEADRRAAEQAEADRRAADARRQSSSTGGGGSGSSGSSGGSSGGGYDGYTGCRAYGKGGSSIDEKGRVYQKIDCTTKAPIG